MFENVFFMFKDGKIIEVIVNDIVCINKVLDIDEGVCFVGEFVIGVNLFIYELM